MAEDHPATKAMPPPAVSPVSTFPDPSISCDTPQTDFAECTGVLDGCEVDGGEIPFSAPPLAQKELPPAVSSTSPSGEETSVADDNNSSGYESALANGHIEEEVTLLPPISSSASEDASAITAMETHTTDDDKKEKETEKVEEKEEEITEHAGGRNASIAPAAVASTTDMEGPVAAVAIEPPTISTAEAESELIECARYGELDELQDILASHGAMSVDAHSGEQAGQNTALHMASANGHKECARSLLNAGARHLPNSSGNYPLHWACRAGHGEVVSLLLSHFSAPPGPEGTTVDVLARNDFGRSSLTEAFDKGDTECIQFVLEHETAEEGRIIGNLDGEEVLGKEGEKSGPLVGVGDVDAKKTGDANTSDTKVGGAKEEPLGAVHEFALACKQDESNEEREYADQKVGGTMLMRELPISHPDDPFGDAPIDDTTGLAIWAASIVAARWLADPPGRFDGASLLELGAGCGLPGLSAAHHSRPSYVVLSDLNPDTVANMEHNVSLNAGRGQMNMEEHSSAIISTSYDWDDKASHPRCPTRKDGRFDYVIGSDLIYQKDVVPHLIKAVRGTLADDGAFLYVCPEGGRDGLDEFIEAMDGDGFRCASKKDAPDVYRGNPLAGGDDEECFLHFHELFSTGYVLYEFRKA